MLFEQIAKNKRKTIVLFVGFFLFMGIVGAALGYYMLGEWVPGVIIAVVTGIVYAVYMFGQSTDVVMGMNHAQEITSADQAPDLWHIVEDMALVAMCQCHVCLLLMIQALTLLQQGMILNTQRSPQLQELCQY